MTKNTSRKCVLVLGMHRCGTSAVTRTIGYLGARLPKTMCYAAADNPKGFWGPQPVSWVNDQLLQRLGSSWYDWRALPVTGLSEASLACWHDEIRKILVAEYGDAPLFVIKDPHICRFPKLFLDVLKDLQVTPHIVIPFRNPLEVAHSLERRNGFNSEKSLLLWLRHVLDAESSTRHLPRAFISYDWLLTDWQASMRSVSKSTSLTWPNAFSDIATDIEEFLTPDLRHHKCTIANNENTYSESWFDKAFRALLSLERDPQDSQAYEILRRLNQSFDTACAAIDDNELSRAERLIFKSAVIDIPIISGGDKVPVSVSVPLEPSGNITKKPIFPMPSFNNNNEYEKVSEQTSYPIAVHKAPMILPANRDTCLLVGYAPDGRPTPALIELVKRLAAEGVDCYVCLAVNDAEIPIDETDLDAASAIFARVNGGYDFAAWACASLLLIPSSGNRRDCSSSMTASSLFVACLK